MSKLSDVAAIGVSVLAASCAADGKDCGREGSNDCPPGVHLGVNYVDNSGGTGGEAGSTETVGGNGGSTETCDPMATEQCNGIDDNCNGQIDEKIAGINQMCQTTLGCADSDIVEGTTVCNGKAGIECVPNKVPDEVCDGKDNNCDGTVDEPNLALGEFVSCSTNYSGICTEGQTKCTEGELVCEAYVEPGTIKEACDGQDNDCDGEVDEELPNSGKPCNVPGLKGPCEDGYWECKGASGWECKQVVFPSPFGEMCQNGVDDDCDGFTDENVPPFNSCTNPLPAQPPIENSFIMWVPHWIKQ